MSLFSTDALVRMLGKEGEWKSNTTSNPIAVPSEKFVEQTSFAYFDVYEINKKKWLIEKLI